MEEGSFQIRNVSKRTKLHDDVGALYGAETWAVTQQELRELHAFQMKCLQEIVGVTLWDRRRMYMTGRRTAAS